VESLKSENDRLVRDASRQSGAASAAPRIMKTTGRGNNKQSPSLLREGERDLASASTALPADEQTAGDQQQPGTPLLASSASEGHNKNRQLAAISTSTRVQRSLFTPYASPVAPGEDVDLLEIQERYAPP
jgi:hypothetical protein